jgi:hypothetical protein
MATRSNIGILNQDGTVNYIYCHYDGYIDYNGKTLNEHYTTEDKVRELIDLGNLSALMYSIEDCVAYHRDKGETKREARTCSYVDYTKEYFEEYVYLFTPGHGWEVREYGVGYWADLDKALNNEMINQSIIKNQ